MAASWPAQKDEWIDEWLIWQFKGKPSPAPLGLPTVIPSYAFDVKAWCSWRRKGKPLPRPNVTTTVQAWSEPLLKKLAAAVPVAIAATPEPWVLAWSIWRFRNSPVADRPPNLPDDYSVTSPYVWSYLRWAAWKRSGIPARPVDVPATVPQWCWDHLHKLNIAVPVKPAPPPPPPPDPVPDSSWTLPSPLMFTTWGWLNDGAFRDSDDALKWIRDVAKARTIGLQIGQFSPDVPDRCRAYGFKIALWGSPATTDQQALVDADADGYLPQMEGPYEYLRLIDNLEAGVGANLPRSLVTTLAGFDTPITLASGEASTVEAEKVKAHGVTHAWVECYKQGGHSHFPISKMEWSLKHRGLPHFSPLIGLYWDVPVSDYQPELDAFGKQIGSYTAETMRPIDRVEFGNLGS